MAVQLSKVAVDVRRRVCRDRSRQVLVGKRFVFSDLLLVGRVEDIDQGLAIDFLVIL